MAELLPDALFTKERLAATNEGLLARGRHRTMLYVAWTLRPGPRDRWGAAWIERGAARKR